MGGTQANTFTITLTETEMKMVVKGLEMRHEKVRYEGEKARIKSQDFDYGSVEQEELEAKADTYGRYETLYGNLIYKLETEILKK